MMLQQTASCTDDRPCPRHGPCARCMAVKVLDDEDWYIIFFYRLVSDQVVVAGNSALPRIEGYEASLRIHGYPEGHHMFLTQSATMLHRLIGKQDTVEWKMETGKRFGEIKPADVT